MRCSTSCTCTVQEHEVMKIEITKLTEPDSVFANLPRSQGARIRIALSKAKAVRCVSTSVPSITHPIVGESLRANCFLMSTLEEEANLSRDYHLPGRSPSRLILLWTILEVVPCTFFLRRNSFFKNSKFGRVVESFRWSVSQEGGSSATEK